MSQKVLITGGLGFLGRHLSRLLLTLGYEVRVIDNLAQHTFSNTNNTAFPIDTEVEFIQGDLRNQEIIASALTGVDIVVHFAARGGVIESMNKISEYIDNNSTATAILIESILKKGGVEKLIVGSGVAVYGEGLYMDQNGKSYPMAARSHEQLKQGKWDLTEPNGEDLISVPTPEFKPKNPISIYGQSKFAQEQICLLAGQVHNLPIAVLRFFNVYGPGKNIYSPSIDVLTTIGLRLLNNKAPLLFEDGFQGRDFIHVRDALEACQRVLEKGFTGNLIYNIGSGKSLSIREIALKLAIIMGKDKIQPEVSRKYRFGDMRHCFADITQASTELGFSPSIDHDSGLIEFAEWLERQPISSKTTLISSDVLSKNLTT